MPDQSMLFSSGDLRSYLDQVAQKADRKLLGYDPDELLLAAEADVIDYLLDLATVEELMLHRELTHMLPPQEIIKPSPRLQWSDQRVTRWTRVVPFSGDRALFLLNARNALERSPSMTANPDGATAAATRDRAFPPAWR